MRKVAVVDLDDTIVSLVPELIKVCNVLTGKSITTEDWTQYDAYVMYGIDPETYWNICTTEKILENAAPIIGARESLMEVSLRNYDIHYLTARGWHPDGFNITKRWLESNKFIHDYDDHIHVVSLDTNKADYVKERFGKADLVVDDNAKHIKSFLDKNAASRVFLIDQPWNRHTTELDPWRVSSIKELKYYADIDYL